jgi:outer membrane biosynthesis protein TonB
MSYGRVVPKVLLAHAALLALFIVVPLLRDCRWFRTPPVETIEIDLASLPPPPAPPEPPAPEEEPEEEVIPEHTPVPTPRPQATATPKPDRTPEPTATPRPAPTPTPTPKPRYLTPEEVRRRIQSQDSSPEPPPAAPTLSPEQIRAQMAQGLPTGGGASIPTGPTGGQVDFSGVSGVLYRKLYSAWVQPRHLSAASGVKATAKVEVARDGRVLSTGFVVRSGNEEFDQSVQSALSSVSTASPLPDAFEGTSETFEFEFELSR